MKLNGLGVAMVTPFTNNGNIDLDALDKLTESLIQGGVDFLVVMGTTGESPTLDVKEKSIVLKRVLTVNNERIPVVYGLGGNNTKALVQEIEQFDFTGVSAILSVSPSYNKPTQEGIFQHFMAVAKSSPVPVILYNVPGRTGSNVTADTCLRIAREASNVISVKEASGDLKQIKRIIDGAPSGFSVFSGDDALTIPVIKAGGVGVISVIGNAFPNMFSELTHSIMDNNEQRAIELNKLLDPIIPLLFEEGNPAGVKAVLDLQNMASSEVRLPLVAASNRLKSLLKEELKAIETLAY